MAFSGEKIRNIALLGHNGVGKTQLNEAILYIAGAIPSAGRTDDGKTVSDYTEEEIQRKQLSPKTSCRRTTFWDYEEEKMNDVDNWSDPYGDEQSYNDGWSKEDIESGLADAFEGDLDARWNKE